MEDNGIRPVVMNARGCSMTQLKTPRYFNCKYTGDIRTLVNHVHAKYPDAPLFASSYSLGSNLLTLYLGEEGMFLLQKVEILSIRQGTATPLSAAITMANPFCWETIDRWLRRPLNKHVYNYSMCYFAGKGGVYVHQSIAVLTRSLVQYLTRHREMFEDHPEVDIEHVLRSRTLQEYDERITCKLWVSSRWWSA